MRCDNGSSPILSMRQAVTVVGTLNAIQYDKRRFTLHLVDGLKVRCVLVDGDIRALAELLGRRVLVRGMAVWTPAVRPVRIDVDCFAPGDGQPSLWNRLPTPLFGSDLPPEEMTPKPWGIAGIIGQWPGDETDEEILKALEELS